MTSASSPYSSATASRDRKARSNNFVTHIDAFESEVRRTGWTGDLTIELVCGAALQDFSSDTLFEFADRANPMSTVIARNYRMIRKALFQVEAVLAASRTVKLDFHIHPRVRRIKPAVATRMRKRASEFEGSCSGLSPPQR